MNMKDESVRL